ncbi:MAG: hypothetical protein V4805_21150 [Pseudomonadota bacterium]
MKSNFKKTLLANLLLGVGALSITAPAQAVSLSQDGLGQVLIYPYYTVRGGFDTYLSVVNHTDKPKALNLRFREGKNGREVLDFNIYLAAKDIWTAAVTATADGAKIITADKSCTYPAIPAGGQAFANFAFTDAVVPGIRNWGGDGETQSLDRTREGYFEIIEMGTITNTAITAAMTHTSGVPANCDLVQMSNMSLDAGATAAAPPSGGLSGTATLINVAAGTDYSYDPVVLSGFSNVNIWSHPGSLTPNLSLATPKTSLVLHNDEAVSSTWAKGEDAVSALMMHDTLLNEFVLDTATLSGTDWVVTMPTKHFYVPVEGDMSFPSAPFIKEFHAGGACEFATNAYQPYWGREGNGYSLGGVWGVPPAVPAFELCWESSVVTFNNSAVLASSNSANFDVQPANGWATFLFSGYGSVTIPTLSSLNGDTYVGLPTIGFMVQDFVNGNVNGLLSNYGGSFRHKYTSNINGH